MIKTTKKTLGFTLIEMMIYIALVSIIIFSFVSFSLDVTGTAQKARVKQEVQQNARFAMERIIQEIRSANTLNTGNSTFNTHPGILSLGTNNPATDPTIFDLSAGAVRITQGVSAPENLTSTNLVITNLVFKNRSVTGRTSNVKVELTLEHPNPENSEIYNVSVTVKGSAVIRKSEN